MRTLFCLSTILLLFNSCCGYIKCVGPDLTRQFRLLSAVNGKDLVFGPSKIYNKDQIRFYSFIGQDTTYLAYQPLYHHNIDYDSTLYVTFLPNVNTTYMQLSNGDIDTLTTTFKKSDGGACCPDGIFIDNFRFNTVDLGSNNYILTLNK